ncbi:MAG TPA: hypothetical protein VN038_19050, partial [Dyadobacter sp.]|nr:hypothetical protein [Dyadobacter sp.]
MLSKQVVTLRFATTRLNQKHQHFKIEYIVIAINNAIRNNFGSYISHDGSAEGQLPLLISLIYPYFDIVETVPAVINVES